MKEKMRERNGSHPIERNGQESDAESTFMPAAMNMPYNQPYTLCRICGTTSSLGKILFVFLPMSQHNRLHISLLNWAHGVFCDYPLADFGPAEMAHRSNARHRGASHGSWWFSARSVGTKFSRLPHSAHAILRFARWRCVDSKLLSQSPARTFAPRPT